MSRWPLLLLIFAARTGIVSAQEALPSRQAGEKADAESKLFRNDPGDAAPPGEPGGLLVPEIESNVENSTVEKLKTAYERAQRKQQRWQRLVKAGVLAQIEGEAAALQTARARAKYERARAVQQERAVAALRIRVDAQEITAEALAAAESALQTAQAMALEAESALQRTQLLQAEANLDRQRRLAAAGVGPKRVIRRAQAYDRD